MPHEPVWQVDADASGESDPGGEAGIDLDQLDVGAGVDALELEGSPPAGEADELRANSEQAGMLDGHAGPDLPEMGGGELLDRDQAEIAAGAIAHPDDVELIAEDGLLQEDGPAPLRRERRHVVNGIVPMADTVGLVIGALDEGGQRTFLPGGGEVGDGLYAPSARMLRADPRREVGEVLLVAQPELVLGREEGAQALARELVLEADVERQLGVETRDDQAQAMTVAQLQQARVIGLPALAGERHEGAVVEVLPQVMSRIIRLVAEPDDRPGATGQSQAFCHRHTGTRIVRRVDAADGDRLVTVQGHQSMSLARANWVRNSSTSLSARPSGIPYSRAIVAATSSTVSPRRNDLMTNSAVSLRRKHSPVMGLKAKPSALIASVCRRLMANGEATIIASSILRHD